RSPVGCGAGGCSAPAGAGAVHRDVCTGAQRPHQNLAQGRGTSRGVGGGIDDRDRAHRVVRGGGSRAPRIQLGLKQGAAVTGALGSFRRVRPCRGGAAPAMTGTESVSVLSSTLFPTSSCCSAEAEPGEAEEVVDDIS